jgi:hypothetical protein
LRDRPHGHSREHDGESGLTVRLDYSNIGRVYVADRDRLWMAVDGAERLVGNCGSLNRGLIVAAVNSSATEPERDRVGSIRSLIVPIMRPLT